MVRAMEYRTGHQLNSGQKIRRFTPEDRNVQVPGSTGQMESGHRFTPLDPSSASNDWMEVLRVTVGYVGVTATDTRAMTCSGTPYSLNGGRGLAC